jgi:PPK2 family polyphosphate:nucleotide phosphotransferase
MPKSQPLVPPTDKKVKLKDYDPAYTGEFQSEEEVAPLIQKDLERMNELQERLFAESKRSVLVVLQATDTGGKDGTIKHIFRGLNPQGVDIAAFKAPTSIELAHDFLWRIHPHAPAKGGFTIFNRSHYEDVLIVRVHNLVPKEVWKERYDHINRFEELLAESGTTILKFYLYISKEEQKERFLNRINNPEKNWKFAMGDLDERQHWDAYTEAFEAAINKCNTPYAPWHIVPANHKWYRNYIVSRTIVEALEKMNPQYPPAPEGLDKVVIPD